MRLVTPANTRAAQRGLSFDGMWFSRLGVRQTSRAPLYSPDLLRWGRKAEANSQVCCAPMVCAIAQRAESARNSSAVPASIRARCALVMPFIDRIIAPATRSPSGNG